MRTVNERWTELTGIFSAFTSDREMRGNKVSQTTIVILTRQLQKPNQTIFFVFKRVSNALGQHCWAKLHYKRPKVQYTYYMKVS